MNVQTPKKLLPKDFATDQEVRWCPGCGDYAILKGVQKTLADLAADPVKTVFVSGIGCSSRFPYYMATYGFHTIHGRAPAIATGIKLANPELDVWLVSGDGDGLSIGGNHTMHAIRRNVDLKFLLFNNEIYGLTKGQFSPTSRLGTKSPSTPGGSIDPPISALQFAMGANARFIARTIDRRVDHMPEVLKRAAAHKGCSFIEIIQNCIVYNDGVFDHFTEKEVKDVMQLELEDGKPMLFGKNREKGLRFNPKSMTLEVIDVGAGGHTVDDVIVHDEKNRMLATLLAQLEPPDYPVPIGVLYCNPAPAYEAVVTGQVAAAKAKLNGKKADLNALLRKGATWTVTG
jgi:2-oxoglutarate ferredoxin oxidoreductase subunit beta